MVSRKFYNKVNQVLKTRLERKYLGVETDIEDNPPLFYNRNGMNAQAGPGFNYGICNFPIPIPGNNPDNMHGEEIDVSSFQFSCFFRNDIPLASGHFRLLIWQWFPQVTMQNVSAASYGGIVANTNVLSGPSGSLMLDNGVLDKLTSNTQENMVALYGRDQSQSYAILHDKIYKYDQMNQQTGYQVPITTDGDQAAYVVPSTAGSPYYKFVNLTIRPPKKTCKIHRLSGDDSSLSEVTNWVFWTVIDLSLAGNGTNFGNSMTGNFRTNFTDA